MRMLFCTLLISPLISLGQTKVQILDRQINQQPVQQQLFEGQKALDTTPITSDQIPHKLTGNPSNPVIVLIHGLGSNQGTWDSARLSLEKKYYVLTYDQRGHGQSGIESENYSSSTMAHDLLVLLDDLKIKSAHILGHSMGGRTAMRFASDYPDRVKSVIIEDMHMMGRSKLLQDNLDLARAVKPLYKPSFASADEFYNTYKPYMHWQNFSAIYDFGTKEIDGRFHLWFKPHVHFLYQQQGLQEDLTEALITTKAPIEFLAAENDPVLFGKGVEHITLNKPEAKIKMIPNTSHSIHSSQSELFLAEVNTFVSSQKSLVAARSCSGLF